MALSLLRQRALSPSLKWCGANICTSVTKLADDPAAVAARKEAPIRNDLALLKPEELEQRKKLQGYITVEGPTDLSLVSGVPEELLKNCVVRIYEPAKNAMQSGTDNIGHWEMDFDNKERWENPLMGWCSSGDPLSNLKMQFTTKEEAIHYCEQNGWQYYIQSSSTERPFKPKSYGINFSWNKRTRTSTK